MKTTDIPRHRLAHQHIHWGRHQTPADVVAALGAMQSQDYTSALWSIGLRLPGGTEKMVEQAVAERKIVRTWPMRGTLHFVAAADVRWLLELLTPRVLAGSVRRWEELELDVATFARCRKLFIKALSGGRQLTREALLKFLEQNGVKTGPHRGYHILWRLAQEGVICFAAREGKQLTFALLDEWVPTAKTLKHDEALVELARRYFTSHGPATLADFAWWSGLKVADARAGLEGAAPQLSKLTGDSGDYWMAKEAPVAQDVPSAHLLPGFDEYLLGYTDRSAVLEPRHAAKIVPGGNGVFLPTIVLNGRVVGTWKRTVTKKKIAVQISPFANLKKADKLAVAQAAEHYGRFAGLPVEL